MTVNLDTNELFYLLDNCLRGSHLRSMTIKRFVDQWWQNMTEEQRFCLFEWTVRLSYAWSGHGYFEPSSTCCGKDTIFMKRFHPDNQYMVTIEGNGMKETVRAFKMDGKYYIGSSRYCGEEYITNVEKLDLPKWKEYKQPNIDYDKNILEP